MKENNKSFTLNDKEMVFMAAKHGGNILLGVKDPFQGCLADQVEDAWQKCKTDLIEKELLTELNEGKTILSDEISKVMNICCFPETCFLLTHKDESGTNRQIYFYMNNNSIIRQSKIDEKNLVYEFEIIEEKNQLKEELNNIIKQFEDNSNEVQCTFSSNDFYKLIEEVNKGNKDAFVEELSKNDITNDDSLKIHDIITKGNPKLSLVVLKQKSKKRVISEITLTESEGFWEFFVIEDDKVKNISVQPYAQEQAIKHFMNIIMDSEEEVNW